MVVEPALVPRPISRCSTILYQVKLDKACRHPSFHSQQTKFLAHFWWWTGLCRWHKAFSSAALKSAHMAMPDTASHGHDLTMAGSRFNIAWPIVCPKLMEDTVISSSQLPSCFCLTRMFNQVSTYVLCSLQNHLAPLREPIVLDPQSNHTWYVTSPIPSINSLF